MAPANGSAKSRKSAANKQTQGPRPVVPAIPLPYVKRQAAAADARRQDTNGVPAAEPLAEEKASPNTTSQQATGDVVEPAASPKPKVQTNGQATPSTIEPITSPTNEANLATAAVTSPTTVVPGPKATDRPAQESLSEQSSETQAKTNGAAPATKKTQPKHKPAADHPSVDISKSRPPPSMSPTRYHMPPPFQPAGRPLGMMPNGEMPRGPRPPIPNGPPHMHSAHPSASSVHFGAFHDSASSSPAPHAGGIAPPPGMQMPDGRPYMGPPANGFPPMMPYGAEMGPGSGFDSYGRPMGFAPMESYPPYGNNFGPSTPHSFHGSQSSAHPEDNAMYNQFPPGGPRNNGLGPGDEVQPQNHQGRMFGGPDYPRMMPNPGMHSQMMPQNDDADGMVGYMLQQFGVPEMSDCTLELRFLDDRESPVRIPGHRLILARSPQLSNIIRKQALQQSPSDQSQQILLLETDSRWIRPDAFYMATQRLYGAPLLPIPPRSMESNEMTALGSAEDRLGFTLAYAAAGHLLQWSSLVRRGCEVATQVLNWQTMEKTLEFALEDFSDNGVYDAFKFGDGSKMLLHSIVTFIVHNLPPSFTVDAFATEPEQYARLPRYAPPTASPSDEPSSPASTRGSVQLGKNRRSRKLSTIQFGDMSLSDAQNDAATETPKASRQAHPVPHAVLSRVLLNLPFSHLKMILESSGSGNVSSWANTELRYRIIKDVVQEREKRRRAAVEAVIGGRVPDAETVRAHLRSPEPRVYGQWTILGWEEEILPYGSNPDGPSLARKWVPLMDFSDVPGAAYP